ncbi:gustatory receptor 46 [Nasonia vitripennis]|uniref:Gustatory receptor n=1 Tax=Nasonia vitripennis TaxID=7425 RepID=A0A7M6UDW4_NASVI|nr:gustatory receptor 46 [Nasonia vitripennis]
MLFLKKSNNKNLDYLKLLFYFFKVFGLASMTIDATTAKNTRNHFWTFTRSKSTVIYNVIFILVFVISNIYSMTFFCRGTYVVNFETIGDCGQTTLSLFVALFILTKSCISRNTLIIIANSISRITDSLLSLSSTSIQENSKISSEIKKMFIINISTWTVLFGTFAFDLKPLTKYGIVVFFSNCIINHLVIQYSVILKLIKHNYKILNENLIEFGDQESMAIRSPSEAKIKVDRLLKLQKLHESLSDTSREVSNYYSYPMLVCVLHVFIILIFVCYYFFKPMILHSKNLSTFTFLRTIGYGFAYGLLLVTLTKCVAATIDEQNRRTKEIIGSCLMISADEKVLNKLNKFSTYLLHRDIKFTVLGLFSLDESLLTTMVGSITTYMVIVLQFQQNLKR